MKRVAQPAVSADGERVLSEYTCSLHQMEDLQAPTIRNYISDLRQFIAWCEQCWLEEREQHAFMPQAVATPLLTRYRTYLQMTLDLTPATVNRALMSLKRYFTWATVRYALVEDPMKPVKFVPKEMPSPRHLSDDEETALLSAVNAGGNLRDKTVVTLLLHTGLRAQELCTLMRQQVTIGKRHGTLRVIGKRNKVRTIPLNVTARTALQGYLTTLPQQQTYLFPSVKTGQALTERALGHLIKKYARIANLLDVSPHDLRHRFGYRMAEQVPLHRLAQIMGHESLDTTMLYIQATQEDLQHEVEKIAWT